MGSAAHRFVYLSSILGAISDGMFAWKEVSGGAGGQHMTSLLSCSAG